MHETLAKIAIDRSTSYICMHILSYMAFAISVQHLDFVLFQPFLITILFGVRCSAKVSAVIVFGDSSVDSGNNRWIPTLARSDFPPYGQDLPGGRPTGRFCNGKLASDFASEAFGLKDLVPAYLDPAFGISDFATGVDFASAGTGYDNATSDVLSVIPLWKQVEYFKEYQERLRAYLGDQTAREIITNAFYLISIGTNDFLENYFSPSSTRKSQYTVEAYQSFLICLAEDFLRKIHNLGARKISLGGILPMGCLPLERATNPSGGDACQDKYNIIARNFNTKLNKLVVKLNEELRPITLIFSNPYDIFLEFFTKPQLYGFDVADRGCCGTGEFEMGFACNRITTFTCPNPNKYVFWDAFHPTERTNKIIIDYLINSTWSQFS